MLTSPSQRQRKTFSLGLFGIVLSLFALSSCGGGGADDTLPTPPPPSSDFGAKTISTVARTGVAGHWGYTAPDGNRYVLMGTAKGILVLDLRDSANPRVVDEIDGPTNTQAPGIYWREMRVFGHYAYIVSEHTNVRGGIMIVDLSGLPNTVRYVKSVMPHDGEMPAHTVDIDTSRGLLYLQREQNGQHGSIPFASSAIAKTKELLTRKIQSEKPLEPIGPANQGAVEIWDVKTDPENPIYVSTFNQNHSVHDMTAVGNFCYVAEGYANSFSKWDVSDPKNPQLVVRWNVEPGHFSHAIWPSGDGTFAVTTEELPVGLPARVWQFNGTAPPTLLSSFRIGTGTPHNVILEGRIAYLSHYSEGAAVVDLTNPAVPRVVAQKDTNGLNGPNLGGCWGVYKFPGVALMSCSDIDTGFHLIEVTGK